MLKSRPLGHRRWVHWSHSIFYMTPLLLLHLGYIVFLAIIIQKYKKETAKVSLVEENPTVIPSSASIFVFRQQDTTAYALWQYLPTTFAVLLGLLWESVDVGVRLLEPYIQMAKEGGATVDNSLTLDYITMFTFYVPFRSAFRGHRVVLLSSLLYITAFTVIPAMSGALWTINWAPVDSVTDGPLYATLQINERVLIATCALNGLVVLSGAILLYTFFSRALPLSRNPKSIGGVASLVCESPGVLNLFHQIDSWGSTNLISSALGQVRFFLQPETITDFNGTRYTRLQITTNVPPNYQITPLQESGQTRRQAHGKWLSAKRVWASEIFFLMSNSIIVPAIGAGSYFVVDHDDYEKNVKPQVIKITYVVIISISGALFQWIHRDIQIFQPYRRFLSPTPYQKFYDAVSREYITLGQPLTTIKGLATHSYIVFMTALSSIIFLIATIFFPIIFELLFSILKELDPTNNADLPRLTDNMMDAYDQQLPAGRVSYYRSLYYWAMAIHALLLINFISILATRQCRPFMPRQPTTIGSQILLLFGAFAMLDRAQRGERRSQRFDQMSPLANGPDLDLVSKTRLRVFTLFPRIVAWTQSKLVRGRRTPS
ncbi:hypothetical protein BKA61DRAFT_654913 [Leptodontidium sp. MPI-SDFR-AT-0119]|nr:hypothetical protein BKA61DRAFT_654913 [Leptodontidium sp. MPI-SDFR-AT-0119]